MIYIGKLDVHKIGPPVGYMQNPATKLWSGVQVRMFSLRNTVVPVLHTGVCSYLLLNAIAQRLVPEGPPLSEIGGWKHTSWVLRYTYSSTPNPNNFCPAARFSKEEQAQ